MLPPERETKSFTLLSGNHDDGKGSSVGSSLTEEDEAHVTKASQGGLRSSAPIPFSERQILGKRVRVIALATAAATLEEHSQPFAAIGIQSTKAASNGGRALECFDGDAEHVLAASGLGFLHDGAEPRDRQLSEGRAQRRVSAKSSRIREFEERSARTIRRLHG